MPGTRQWIVTLSPDRRAGEVAADLAAIGFSVGEILEEIGCITGTAPEDVVVRVRHIAGVANVAPDLQVNLGPPESGRTW